MMASRWFRRFTNKAFNFWSIRNDWLSVIWELHPLPLYSFWNPWPLLKDLWWKFCCKGLTFLTFTCLEFLVSKPIHKLCEHWSHIEINEWLRSVRWSKKVMGQRVAIHCLIWWSSGGLLPLKVLLSSISCLIYSSKSFLN